MKMKQILTSPRASLQGNAVLEAEEPLDIIPKTAVHFESSNSHAGESISLACHPAPLKSEESHFSVLLDSKSDVKKNIPFRTIDASSHSSVWKTSESCLKAISNSVCSDTLSRKGRILFWKVNANHSRKRIIYIREKNLKLDQVALLLINCLCSLPKKLKI
jgi:hypothetical protein